jgi:hypothetical protein
MGAVAGVVGIEVGVVSGVFNLESSGVDAPDWDSGSSMGGHHTPHSGEDSAE